MPGIDLRRAALRSDISRPLLIMARRRPSAGGPAAASTSARDSAMARTATHKRNAPMLIRSPIPSIGVGA